MNEAGISYDGVCCHIKTNETEFTVTITENFTNWVTKKELTTEWKSVGQHNREWIHSKLDEFINEVLNDQRKRVINANRIC